MGTRAVAESTAGCLGRPGMLPARRSQKQLRHGCFRLLNTGERLQTHSLVVCHPVCGQVGGYVEMQNATPIIGHHKEHVKKLKADCGRGEEIDRDQLLGVILEERTLSLRRGLKRTQSDPASSIFRTSTVVITPLR